MNKKGAHPGPYKGAGKECMKKNHLKTWKDFFREEDGMGTVEIILIIVENYLISYSL